MYVCILYVCMYVCIVCMYDLTFILFYFRFVVYIEAAANGMFGAGGGGMINPPDPNREFPLVMAEIAVFKPEVYDLLMDLTVLYDLTKVCVFTVYICHYIPSRKIMGIGNVM